MDFKDKQELDEFILKLGDHPRSWIKRLPPEARELAKKFELLQRDLADKFDELIEENIWKREDVAEALEYYGVCGTDDFIFAFWEASVGKNYFKTALSFSRDRRINAGIVKELVERVIEPLYKFYAFWMCLKSLNDVLPNSTASVNECRKFWDYYEGAGAREWETKISEIKKQFLKAEKLHASILKMIGGEKEVKIKNDPPPPSKPGRL